MQAHNIASSPECGRGEPGNEASTQHNSFGVLQQFSQRVLILTMIVDLNLLKMCSEIQLMFSYLHGTDS